MAARPTSPRFWIVCLGFTVAAGTPAAAHAQRALSDRPDDFSGPQVHVSYVLPSDSTDMQLDTNNAIANSLSAVQTWLASQTGGRRVRIDTYQGVFDVTFVRLNRTDAQMKAYGAFVRDEIEAELLARGYLQREKLYAVYYGGGSTFACGGGSWPPQLDGQVGALYLQGTPPGSPPCNTNVVGSSPVTPQYWEFSLLHEILHTLGVVATCAPHQALGGHVGDDNHDLMYAGTMPWLPSVLDAGNDDYFGHGVAGCLDVANSPFLTPKHADLAVNFGPSFGLYLRYNDGGLAPIWSPLNAARPARMAVGDVDGNGVSDLIASFPGYGVWIWQNNRAWVQLHALEVSDIKAADLDGNGLDDVILDFPGYGLYVRYDNNVWANLHGLSSAGLATANIDNDADHRADLIVNFPGAGVWAWTNNTTWVQMHGLNATLTTGDLDGNGQRDVVFNFPTGGLWVLMNNSVWVQLNGLAGTAAVAANLDGDAAGRADLVVSFPGHGIWVWMNHTAWVQLHGLPAGVLAAADLDADGRSDLIATFAGAGTWILENSSAWRPLHGLAAEAIDVGEFDPR